MTILIMRQETAFCADPKYCIFRPYQVPKGVPEPTKLISLINKCGAKFY